MPRFHAERAAGRLLGLLPRRQHRPNLAGGREQFGGLGADHGDIFVLGGRCVLGDRKLHHLALGDHRRRRGKNLQRLQAADLDHHLERLAEQEIADQDAGFVAPQHAGGEPAAAKLALVDHVVVQKRRRMHELDRGRELDMAVAAIAGEPRQRQRQHRPQPFAAGVDQVIGDLGNHRHLGAGALQDHAIDAFHVRAHEIDQRVDRGPFRTFKRDDDSHAIISLEDGGQ